jgi:hypothetical protein
MSRIYGSIVEVSTVNIGENLTANAAISATAIIVEDVNTFSTVSGEGQLILNGIVYAYTGIDPTTNTITLLTGLDAAAAEDDRAELYPLQPLKRATVDLGIPEGEAIQVVVPYALSATLSEGMREEADQETVLIGEGAAGDFYIVDILASPAIADSGIITTIANIIVAASGWSINTADLRRINKTINFHIEFTRTGGTITVPAHGNITNTPIGTMVDEWRPGASYSQLGLCSGRSGPMAVFAIAGTDSNDGEVVLCAIEPGAGDILTNDALSCGGMYFQL